MLSPVLLFLVSVIAFLGIATSYSDIREGKIRNKFVFPAIAVAIAVNLFSLQFFSYAEFLSNALLALTVGFVLYLSNLWSAADGKLFIAFAMLVPSTINVFGYTPFMPSFSILVNAFVPIFLVLLARLALTVKKAVVFEALKKSFNPKAVGEVVLHIFALSYPLILLFRFFGLELNFFLSLFIIFLMIEILQVFIRTRILYISAVFAVLRLVFDFQNFLNLEFALDFLLLIASFIVLRFFVLHLGFLSYGKIKQINELQEGMVLLDGAIEKDGFYYRKPLFYPSLFTAMEDMKTDYALTIGPTGLTHKDIENLKNWEKAKKLKFRSLMVQETLPFAPFLFLGALLTFVFQGNLVYALLSLL